MTNKEAARIVFNTWVSFLDFEAEIPEEIPENNEPFTIAMKMAYKALMEKSEDEEV